MIKRILKEMYNSHFELMWAKVWEDTKNGIEWMDNLPSLSPGRWAVGYNYIYVMTRVLNELKPKNVLDLGLGISSTLISHYYMGNNVIDGNHDVIEQDDEWINFYSNNNRISPITKINLVESIVKEYKGKQYNAYSDIGSIVEGKKYDVISIDAPKGSEPYSRRDIIEYLPQILSDSFVIIIDDAERIGEKKTIHDIQNILKRNGIECYTGDYHGMSQCTVITSKNNKFFCSM